MASQNYDKSCSKKAPYCALPRGSDKETRRPGSVGIDKRWFNRQPSTLNSLPSMRQWSEGGSAAQVQRWQRDTAVLGPKRPL